MGPPTRAFDSPAPHRSTRKNQTNDHGPHTTKRPYSRQRVPSASNLPLFISQPNSLLHHSKRKPYPRQRVPSVFLHLPLPSSKLIHTLPSTSIRLNSSQPTTTYLHLYSPLSTSIHFYPPLSPLHRLLKYSLRLPYRQWP